MAPTSSTGFSHRSRWTPPPIWGRPGGGGGGVACVEEASCRRHATARQRRLYMLSCFFGDSARSLRSRRNDGTPQEQKGKKKGGGRGISVARHLISAALLFPLHLSGAAPSFRETRKRRAEPPPADRLRENFHVRKTSPPAPLQMERDGPDLLYRLLTSQSVDSSPSWGRPGGGEVNRVTLLTV